ncbi:MAG TPA: glycosyltransferase [Opitutaceae bacterium]|nr:glycosyltransferase [Opitutaceae bacterium]
MEVSVIIAAHNPDRGRLRRTLAGIRAQTLASAAFETILVDNASREPLAQANLAESAPANLRVVVEPQLGLTAARRRGFSEARAPLCVLVDDDNVLAPDYLARSLRLAGRHERVGAFGGRSLPEFEVEPPAWAREFFPLLALRDHGDASHFEEGLRAPGAARNRYPAEAAPIGAGMVLRRAAAQTWMSEGSATLSDRRGTELTSGGDNDIVLTTLKHGWAVAYFPELSLLHLIPAGRLAPEYLARLNHGIQKSWMQVLSRHDANPWPPIARASVPLRQCKAWFTHRAWASPAARIRWQGACGHFEGRVLPAA